MRLSNLSLLLPLPLLLQAVCFFKLLSPLQALEADDEPYQDVQPDGTPITLKLSGDEFKHYLSDINDYRVIQDEAGYYVYADIHADGQVHPTIFRLGENIDPDEMGLEKASMDQIRTDVGDCTGLSCDANARSYGVGLRIRNGTGPSSTPNTFNTSEQMELQQQRPQQQQQQQLSLKINSNRAHLMQEQHVLKNLVVLIRWKDHVDRILPSRSDIDILMNKEGGDADICPTGSVRDVFLENSYGQVQIDSTVLDWITVSGSEKDFASGKSGLSFKFHAAIHEALDKVDPLIDFRDFDADGDGWIDSITFIHSGYAAEFGGKDAYGTNTKDRIWSHKWSIWSDGKYYTRQGWKSKEGVSVFDYNINPALWHRAGGHIGRIGVIAHELGHFLGVTDLYDGKGGRGIGRYGLMGSGSWGFDKQQLHPTHASAWTKLKWNWSLAATPQENGLNLISSAEDQNPTHPQIYKIGDGNHGFPIGEYLLIENRQKRGFDTTLPQGGLIIWKIDDSLDDDFSIEGYPDQDGWPRNGKHYRVAMLQADGEYDLESGRNRGDDGDMFHGNGVSRLAPSDSLDGGPFPNTDSYQGGDLKTTENYIYDISVSAGMMSFRWCNGFGCDTTGSPTIQPTDRPSASPTASPSRTPSAAPTMRPSALPSARPTISPSGRPTRFPTLSPTIIPTSLPTFMPSEEPTHKPSFRATSSPTVMPTVMPTTEPSFGASSVAAVGEIDFCESLDELCTADEECCTGYCRIFVVKFNTPSVCKERPTAPPTEEEGVCGGVRSDCYDDDDCCGQLACRIPRFRPRSGRCYDPIGN